MWQRTNTEQVVIILKLSASSIVPILFPVLLKSFEKMVACSIYCSIMESPDKKLKYPVRFQQLDVASCSLGNLKRRGFDNLSWQ